MLYLDMLKGVYAVLTCSSPCFAEEGGSQPVAMMSLPPSIER